MGFAQNVIPFSLATSFVVARILRNATAAEDVWSKYDFELNFLSRLPNSVF